MYDKRLNAKRIEGAFRGKLAMKFEDRKFMAENIYANLDEMMVNPTESGFIDLVDNVNMLVNLIYATNTRANRRKIGKVPDIHHWLCERHEYVARSINMAHDYLIEIEKKWLDRRTYTLDSSTILMVEKCLTMLQEALSVTPMNLLAWAINKGQGIHRKKADGLHITHFYLDEDYIIKEEEIWEVVEDGNGIPD